MSVSLIQVHAQTSQGFQVTAVSLTNILHPGQSASQTQWLITASVNGNGQSVVSSGSLSNSSLSSTCGVACQGITAQYPVQITANANPEVEIFKINNNQPQQLYLYTSTTTQGTVSISGLIGDVYSATPAPWCTATYSGYSYSNEWDYNISTKAGTFGSTGSVTVIRTCIYSKFVGTGSQGDIQSPPYVQASTNFVITSNGKQEILNVSNFGQQSASSPDGAVHVTWTGNLGTGNPTIDISQQIAINNLQTNNWVISNLNTFTSWTTDYSNTKSKLYPQGIQQFTYYNNYTVATMGCQGIAQTSSTYTNQSVANLAGCMNTKVINYYNPTNTDVNNLLAGGSLLGGNQYQQSNYQGSQSLSVSRTGYFTTIQQLTFNISGSFIGVLIPLGKPKIASVVASPFNSGGNGTIKVQVQNIAQYGSGSFYASLSNCGGVGTGSQTKYNVAPGGSQEIDVPIFATSLNQSISESCTVTITDVNGGGSDTAQVNIKVTLPNQCTPNTQVLNGQSICPCLNESSVWKVGTGNACTTCNYGFISNGNGGYECAPPPTTIATTTVTNTQATTSQATTTIPQIGQTDVVIVTIGSKLNEDANYKNTLTQYQNLLSSEGLTSIYLELDSNEYSSVFGSNPNINDWHSIKDAINKIEYKTNATYVIILGGTNIIPMPGVNSSVSFNEGWGGSNPYIIFTDDPYGSLTNSDIPSLVVSRIPGNNADEIAKFLNNGIEKHSNNNYNLLISGDGLNTSWDTDGFVRHDTNSFSLNITGISCDNNSNCLYSPKYCLASGCASSSTFKNYLSNTYGIQLFDCHGNGYVCTDKYGTYMITSTSLIPTLNTNPIIMYGACFDGAINSTSVGDSNMPKTLAIQTMDNGAADYIGNTEEGLGGYGVQAVTPAELFSIYTNFKNGDTIGKAFLAMKIKFLTNPSDPYTEGTAQELQLYGDPTISYTS